jgi:hypothetical protein
MAEDACEILIGKIAGLDDTPQHHILLTELVVRESCGAKEIPPPSLDVKEAQLRKEIIH